MKDDKLTLFEHGTKSAISAVDPSFGVIPSIIDWGISSFEKKRDTTIQKFYKDLFEGIASDEEVTYMKEQIKATEDDAYRLLNAAIMDDEAEKSPYYTRLYKYILRNQHMEKYIKLNLLRIIKGISFRSIQLLAKIYVHQNYPTTEITTAKEYMNSLINDSTQSYDLNILTQFGILKQIQLVGGYTLKTSDLFDELICIFFQNEELTPESLNIKVWAKKILLLANNVTGGDIKYIENVISQGTNKVIMHNNYDILTNKNSNIEIKKFDYIICVLGANKINDKHLDILISIPRLLKVFIKEPPIDQLSKVEGKMYNISEKNPNDIDEFIQRLKQ